MVGHGGVFAQWGRVTTLTLALARVSLSQGARGQTGRPPVPTLSLGERVAAIAAGEGGRVSAEGGEGWG